MRRFLASVAFAAAVAIAAGAAAPLATRPAGPTLTDLSGVDDLHARFDRDRGHVRIVLLLSPT